MGILDADLDKRWLAVHVIASFGVDTTMDFSLAARVGHAGDDGGHGHR
jgi:hypothetical protein